MLLHCLTVTLLCAVYVNAHGGPPGVPPRQDQAPPGHQPPQPPQQQQFQQPPPTQQQHYDPSQVNVQEGHGHGTGLRFQSEIHNADHIIEHLQNVIKTKPKEQMTEEELEFHYFKMHDYDNNNKLDGVEIGKALTHFHDDGKGRKPPPTPDEELGDMIDEVLAEDDLNHDGYVDYGEFVKGQRARRKQDNKQDQGAYNPDMF